MQRVAFWNAATAGAGSTGSTPSGALIRAYGPRQGDDSAGPELASPFGPRPTASAASLSYVPPAASLYRGHSSASFALEPPLPSKQSR